MEQILEMITTYGLETVLIGLFVNLLTGVVKKPIKSLSYKLKDYTKVTRFIVFLPIVFSFLLSYLYVRFVIGTFNFDRQFITMWLTSCSLSLSFYAIFEKFVPSKKKMLTDCEIKTSEKILTAIKQFVEQGLSNETVEKVSDKPLVESGCMKSEEIKNSKIILRGKIDAETNVEK